MRNKYKLPLNFQIIIWFSLASITIFVLGFATMKAYDDNLTEYSLRQKQFTNIISILNIEHYLEDATDNQSSFLLTGGEEHLKAYDKSVKDANSFLNKMKSNAISEESNFYIISLDSSMKVMIANMNMFIQNRNDNKTENNLLTIAGTRNMMDMKNIKSILNKIHEIENSKLNIHTDAAASTARNTRTLLPVSIAAALIFITIGFLKIRRDMTARGKAEEESERIFRLSPDLLCISNRNGDFIKLNPAWEKILGYSIKELLNKNFSDLLHPDDAEKSKKGSADISEGKDISLFENRYRAKDGSYRWIQWSSTYDKESGLAYSSGKDVTDERVHENEVKELNERLIKSYEETERIFTLSLDMLCIADFNGYFKKLNPAFEKTLGYTLDELMAKPFIEFVHPEDKEATLNAVNDLAAGKNVKIENRYLAKDGKYKWIQWAAAPLVDAGLIYSSAKEITNIKEKEREVKKLNEKLLNSYAETERIFLLSANLMSITNMEGEFKKINPAWEKVLGYSTEELLATKFINMVHPDDVEITKKASIDVRAGKDISSLENRFLTKDGIYKWLRWYATAVPEEGLVYATAIDITDEKNKEYELRTLNERLYESYKEMESFSYSVSHDLRAPLRHTLGFSQKLKRTSFDKIDEEGRRNIEKIISSAENMSRLIDDLLHFSRIGRGELNLINIDMNVFINTLKMNLAIPAERNIKWNISALPTVKADPVYMSLALNNLLSNAVKYTSKKEKAEIDILCKEEYYEYVFCIKDNGVGFDMKYADKLFGVFQRLHSTDEFEGTGIGLAITHKVIQKHGGRLWAEGEPGAGAAFYFSLLKST